MIGSNYNLISMFELSILIKKNKIYLSTSQNFELV